MKPPDVRVQGAPARVQADPSLIARALENMTENARHYGGGADVVEVAFDHDAAPVLETSSGGVSVWVHDRGPGLPEGDPAQIFALFYRKGGTEHGGLGLGLTLVERIARAHGGEVRAERRVGGGASVGFWLPTIAADT